MKSGRAPRWAGALAEDASRSRPATPANKNKSQNGHDISGPLLQTCRSDSTVEKWWEKRAWAFVAGHARTVVFVEAEATVVIYPTVTMKRLLDTVLGQRSPKKVKPGSAKVAPVWVAPKDAEKPVE